MTQDTQKPDILCIGSVLWDIIGRAPVVMRQGSDVPGRITRLPGGVAMNIAMALVRFGLRPAVLTAIGRDAEGAELVAASERLGVDTRLAYRSEDLPTDRYMAIEGANGLIAAVADAHSLEAAGARILRPLEDGRLGTPAAPYGGVVPEIAARAHVERLDVAVEKALVESGVTLGDLDAVAVTAGPGLIGGVLSVPSCAR